MFRFSRERTPCTVDPSHHAPRPGFFAVSLVGPGASGRLTWQCDIRGRGARSGPAPIRVLINGICELVCTIGACVLPVLSPSLSWSRPGQLSRTSTAAVMSISKVPAPVAAWSIPARQCQTLMAHPWHASTCAAGPMAGFFGCPITAAAGVGRSKTRRSYRRARTGVSRCRKRTRNGGRFSVQCLRPCGLRLHQWFSPRASNATR